MTSTFPTSSAFPTTSARTLDGVTHIDLNFASAMGKGSGSIFVTDGAVQTVIDRATGQPKLRVVGATFTREISLDQVQVSGTHVLFDATGLPPGASLNVYMGAGTLLSGGKPAGAITVPGSASFTTPAGAAALSATLTLAEGVLKAGAPLEMVVSFSHAVNEVPASVFSAEHARVEYVSRSTDGLRWTFRLVQDDSVDSASNVVRLNLADVQPRDTVPHTGTVTSSPYAVDTVLPDVASAPEGHVALDLDASLVITFTEAVHWSADTETSDPEYREDMLAIWVGDGHRRIDFDASWLSADGLTLRIPAAVHQLIADLSYWIVLPRTLTDAAGNPLDEYEIAFHTDDGRLPSAEQATVYAYGSRHYGVGDQIEIYVSFSEDVQVGATPPALVLNNGKEARFVEANGDRMLFVYTVAANDDVARLAIADTSKLAGRVTDLSGKLLDAAHIEFDAIHDGYGMLAELVIDTTAPVAPAAATLAAASDSGTPGDNITNDASPALRGSAE
ncbi:MAG: hypothetical protein EOP92_14870, partial [Lysobacteraceae bacterium]